MSESVVYVGMDVHKDSITIAVAREGREAAAKWKTIPYDGVRLRKALKSLVRDVKALRVCYEAGPTGLGLCRRLRTAGIDCLVLAPLVQAFQAFRGVSVVSAVTIAAEVGDLRRFATAGQFMSYVGLVPSEDSTGKRRRQGAITRCGNGHLRRILVEAAWHYRHAPVMSKELRRRNRGVAEAVRRIAWNAQIGEPRRRGRVLGGNTVRGILVPPLRPSLLDARS